MRMSIDSANKANKSELISWMAISLALILPSICLDYTHSAGDKVYQSVPFGPYIFFFITIISAVFFLSLSPPNLYLFLKDKILWFFSTLFVLGVLISSPSIWGIRLFSIVFIISACMAILSCHVQTKDSKGQLIVFLIVLFPFAVPMAGSLLLEILGPIKLGLTFENLKHKNYSPPRWYFLYTSANGFGLSCAIVSIGSYISCFISKNLIWRVFSLACLFVSIYLLYQSGTRAAFVFTMFAGLFFHLLYFGLRSFLLLIFIILFLFGVLTSIVGWESIESYLRLDGTDLNRISSKRWDSILLMWEVFKESKFIGLGFGAADNNFPTYPSNVFYPAILVEIGLLGSLGVFGIIGMALYSALKRMILMKRFSILSSSSHLSVFSMCVLAGFVPYLMFEFNIFRVSAINQLFFICWSHAMLVLNHKASN